MDGSGRMSGGRGLRLARLSLRRLRWRFALPLLALAVLLQADAVVKSAVMNLLAIGDAASAPCQMGMAGMGAGAAATTGALRSPSDTRNTAPDRGQPASHTACGYCAAAAHVPILTAVAPVQPSCAVAFTAFRTAAVHGPRGPPPVPPRARGPPRLT